MSNCPVCGIGHIFYEKEVRPYVYKGVELHVERTDGYCDSCGTEILDASLSKDNVRNLQRAKSAHDNLLSGEEILAFRKKFHLTQKVAATLFGGGDSAFAKYESDEIAHNISMDRLLRLSIINPRCIFDLAEMSGFELPKYVSNSILQHTFASLSELIDFSTKKLHFHKIDFQTHIPNAANDNSIEDVFMSFASSDFEFERTALR